MITTATTVKERPRILSAESVRAVLAGSKTQTRRVANTINPALLASGATPEQIANAARCPSGQPGDRLWVRETWAEAPRGYTYRANYDLEDGFGAEVIDLATGQTVPLRWRSPIHMPRRASRLTLEITEVRVERLQKISHMDRLAEGMKIHGSEHMVPGLATEVGFRVLWDKLNAKRGFGWDANPWVWVVSFRRVGVL